MAAANVLTLTGTNFDSEVIKSAKPIVVDFWAEWCGPCKAIAPILAELATEYDGRVRVGKVDVESNQDLAAKYNVQGIPMLLFFRGGEVIEQVIGMKSKRDLKERFDRAAA